MNLSLVSSVAESYKTSTLDAAVERAWFNGIVVVVAAGNGGPDTMQYPPANDPFVITVGATDTKGTNGRGDDSLAPWSSYGTTQDGISKPDLVAPGRYMIAPLVNAGSTLAKQMPDRIVEGGAYIRLSGTSMAAPVVSGVAALMIQKNPKLTNDAIKWILLNNALELKEVVNGVGTPIKGQGAGVVNANSSVNFNGTPGLANQGIPISEQLVGPDGKTTYQTSTWSTSHGAPAHGAPAHGAPAHGAPAPGAPATGRPTSTCRAPRSSNRPANATNQQGQEAYASWPSCTYCHCCSPRSTPCGPKATTRATLPRSTSACSSRGVQGAFRSLNAQQAPRLAPE